MRASWRGERGERDRKEIWGGGGKDRERRGERESSKEKENKKTMLVISGIQIAKYFKGS